MSRNLVLMSVLMVGVFNISPQAVERSSAGEEWTIRGCLEYYLENGDQVSRLLGSLDSLAENLEHELEPYGEPAGISVRYREFVLRNLQEKVQLDQRKWRLPMNTREIERMVFQYEAFKLKVYVSSGVFPKRYFGYFDCKYDTAPIEKRLKKTVHEAVVVINRYQEEQSDPVRLTDLEVAVTFIAEGGAILLRERQDLLKRIHPVSQIGLDDIASGFADLPGLQELLDRELGTDLQGLVGWQSGSQRRAGVMPPDGFVSWVRHGNGEQGPFPYIRRYMTFEEALIGTALMYLWEKQIAARQLLRKGVKPLQQRNLREQFLISSLVYNCGLSHDPENWERIGDFETAATVFRISQENSHRRSRLNVTESGTALTGLLAGEDYAYQPTSWLARYHILQRYGAMEALLRFTDYFSSAGEFVQGE